jgi:hypothetical protein
MLPSRRPLAVRLLAGGALWAEADGGLQAAFAGRQPTEAAHEGGAGEEG